MLLIGGAMSYTFLRAKGLRVGASLCEEDKLELARSLMDDAAGRRIAFRLPDDVMVADRFAEDAAHRVVAPAAIPQGWMGVDIGPQTAAAYADVIARAGTVMWNGPMGVFDCPAFAAGTRAVAEALAGVEAVTIVGRRDSAAAGQQVGLADRPYASAPTTCSGNRRAPIPGRSPLRCSPTCGATTSSSGTPSAASILRKAMKS